MENEKRKTENKERDLNRERLFGNQYPLSAEKVCPACGASRRRGAAKFCRVCGKSLAEGYEPLDRLRASYRLLEKSAPAEVAPRAEIVDLFQTNKNSASESAKALVVYSLVPYLGILFCPFAAVSGGVGAFVAYRQPALGGGRASVYSIALTVVVFAVQLFLWWLLYLVPELGKSV